MRIHLKTQCGEKSNKCNQCDFDLSQTGDLNKHLKIHNGKMSNKCNQCDFAAFVVFRPFYVQKEFLRKILSLPNFDFRDSDNIQTVILENITRSSGAFLFLGGT